VSNCCSHGTFPHFSPQSSHLSICYYHQDLHQGPFHPGLPPRLRHRTPAPAYSPGLRFHPGGEVWVARLSAIHFQGWFIRQVSCYTLLSGFRLPWPPSCCLDEPTPFVVSDERAFRHLNLAFGSSRIASSAYQKWPTSDGTFERSRSTK
jgi:hypothetical protein